MRTLPPPFIKFSKKERVVFSLPEGIAGCEPGVSRPFCCMLIRGFIPSPRVGSTLFRDGLGPGSPRSPPGSSDARNSSSDSNLVFSTTVRYALGRMLFTTFVLGGGSSITAL